MGLLTVGGRPLTFDEAKATGALKTVRDAGVEQFLTTYQESQNDDVEDFPLRWGDEVEFGVFKLTAEETNDDATMTESSSLELQDELPCPQARQGQRRSAQLSLRGAELREQLNMLEASSSSREATWHPEYGSWMIEATPAAPYGDTPRALLAVEESMRLRRTRLVAALADDEVAPTITAFPLLGTDTAPVDESVINPHPRFAALTNNIRSRRGGKSVDIRLPLYHGDEDEFIAGRCHDGSCFSARRPAGDEPSQTHGHSPQPDDVLMDHMAYGMGSSCLQVTLQARNMDESIALYDNLSVLSPIMLALTQASPIFRGRLVDTDARWSVISQSVDDRTDAERGVAGRNANLFDPVSLDMESPSGSPVSSATLFPGADLSGLSSVGYEPGMAGGGIRRLSKSRYDSISSYLGERAQENFGDVACEVDPSVQRRLVASGVPPTVAGHVAHLLTRDPLVVYSDDAEALAAAAAEGKPFARNGNKEFENFNSTNWQTMRWKPPTPDHPEIGWRVEFRAMELGLTDFENAAHSVFVILASRAILAFGLDLVMPLSEVDENMRRAHIRDAAAAATPFYFRSDVLKTATTKSSASAATREMSLDAIMNGEGEAAGGFPGLLNLIRAYLDVAGCRAGSHVRQQLDRYLTLIARRASGEVLTTASYIRQFVLAHDDYCGDAVVSPAIAHDLLTACDQIGRGVRSAPELLGEGVTIAPIDRLGAYERPLPSDPFAAADRDDALGVSSSPLSSAKLNSVPPPGHVRRARSGSLAPLP